MSNLPHVKKPCSNCPFRKDTMKGWLGKERITEILNSDSFVCHKTTDGSIYQRRQCAGHMILNKESNKYYLMAKRLKIPLDLKGLELVFNTKQSCIRTHSKK